MSYECQNLKEWLYMGWLAIRPHSSAKMLMQENDPSQPQRIT